MGGIHQIGLQQTVQNTGADPQRAASSGDKSHVNGQAVQTQPNQGSLIQKAITDSAEEVTMMFQDKSADRLKRRDAKSRLDSRISRLLQKYLKAVNPVKHAEKFTKLAESLKNLSKPTPGAIRDLVREFQESTDDDISEAGVLMALEELCAAEKLDKQTLDAVRQAKSELGTELQQFRREVQEFGGFSETYDKLLSEYGEDDFLSATSQLISHHGAEVQNAGTSADLTKVKATMDCLYNLEVARNTFLDVAKVVQKTNAVLTDTVA